jgi:hypothetical protein
MKQRFCRTGRSTDGVGRDSAPTLPPEARLRRGADAIASAMREKHERRSLVGVEFGLGQLDANPDRPEQFIQGQAHAFGRLDDLHAAAFGREQASDEHAPALLLLVHGGSRRDDGADACYPRQTESAGCFV